VIVQIPVMPRLAFCLTLAEIDVLEVPVKVQAVERRILVVAVRAEVPAALDAPRQKTLAEPDTLGDPATWSVSVRLTRLRSVTLEVPATDAIAETGVFARAETVATAATDMDARLNTFEAKEHVVVPVVVTVVRRRTRHVEAKVEVPAMLLARLILMPAAADTLLVPVIVTMPRFLTEAVQETEDVPETWSRPLAMTFEVEVTLAVEAQAAVVDLMMRPVSVVVAVADTDEEIVLITLVAADRLPPHEIAALAETRFFVTANTELTQDAVNTARTLFLPMADKVEVPARADAARTTTFPTAVVVAVAAHVAVPSVAALDKAVTALVPLIDRRPLHVVLAVDDNVSVQVKVAGQRRITLETADV
jgi:hypothetical protein